MNDPTRMRTTSSSCCWHLSEPTVMCVSIRIPLSFAKLPKVQENWSTLSTGLEKSSMRTVQVLYGKNDMRSVVFRTVENFVQPSRDDALTHKPSLGLCAMCDSRSTSLTSRSESLLLDLHFRAEGRPPALMQSCSPPRQSTCQAVVGNAIVQ